MSHLSCERCARARTRDLLIIRLLLIFGCIVFWNEVAAGAVFGLDVARVGSGLNIAGGLVGVPYTNGDVILFCVSDDQALVAQRKVWDSGKCLVLRQEVLMAGANFVDNSVGAEGRFVVLGRRAANGSISYLGLIDLGVNASNMWNALVQASVSGVLAIAAGVLGAAFTNSFHVRMSREREHLERCEKFAEARRGVVACLRRGEIPVADLSALEAVGEREPAFFGNCVTEIGKIILETRDRRHDGLFLAQAADRIEAIPRVEQ